MSPLLLQLGSMQMKFKTSPWWRSPLLHFKQRTLSFLICSGSIINSLQKIWLTLSDRHLHFLHNNQSKSSIFITNDGKYPLKTHGFISIFTFCVYFPKLLLNFKSFMSSEGQIERLYEQNQRLGYRMNYLNDENNFYRITINNIKKLNLNINKHLLTANNRIANSKNTQNVVDPRTIGESYTAITNKIHLKNFQMKVGNLKRKVDKYQKLHGGSISSLVKQSEELEREVNLYSRDFEYLTIQNQLLDNIYLDDVLISKLMSQQWSVKQTQTQSLASSYKSLPMETKNKGFRVRNSCREKIDELEEQNLKFTNKMEEILKQQKDLKDKKTSLLQKMSVLKEEREKLADQVYENGVNIRVAQALEMDRLRMLIKKENELQEEISKQDVLLEEQYKTNQEYKQKILDRNELEVKDIKSLQEKIKKRTEEVKEIKMKCQNLETGKSRTLIKQK